MLSWKLGWRNLWRRPRRSLINICGVATALLFLVLLLSMTEGLREQLLENGTGLLMGHVQIHHVDYLPDRSVYDTIGGDEALDLDSFRAITREHGFEVVTPRVYGFALLSTGDRSVGGELLGIDPVEELRLSTLLEGLVEGRLLGPSASRELLLSTGLATELQASVGSEIAAVTQAADGSMGNELYQVVGIIRTGLALLDRSLAVLHVSDLQELLALTSTQFHELALKSDDPLAAPALARGLNRDESLPENSEARDWGQLAPQLRDYLALFDGFYGFIIGFVALFAGLGVLNTMMMAVFERTREVGVLTALGMLPSRMVTILLIEAVFLTLIGLVVGLVLSTIVMQPLETHGLDLSRWTGELSMLNTRMDPVLRFKWVWQDVLWSAVSLLLAGLLAALIPALRATRMDPVEALAAPVET